jgi:hypothetical protein
MWCPHPDSYPDPWPLSTLLLSYREERYEKIHNTLNTAPRLPPTGLMVIPSCSSGKGGLTNILSLTSQKNKSSQLNVHCRCMSFICSVQTVHSFAVSGWRDYVWLWMCHLSCPLDGTIVFYVSRSKHNKEEGGRADSWWNSQRTKGFATLLTISDHSVWFIMVCML